MKTETVARLREFIENEGRSCSMDIGGITPEEWDRGDKYLGKMTGDRYLSEFIAK